MEIKSVERWTGDSTYSFETKGMKAEEVKTKKGVGYVELSRFKISNKKRTDCYACGSCSFWKSKPFTSMNDSSDHDGHCEKYNFEASDYAICNGWVAKKGLFSYNPA